MYLEDLIYEDFLPVAIRHKINGKIDPAHCFHCRAAMLFYTVMDGNLKKAEGLLDGLAELGKSLRSVARGDISYRAVHVVHTQPSSARSAAPRRSTKIKQEK
jgi:hypothetical protein